MPNPPIALRIAGTLPPIAMLWAKANRLPDTTLPIPACTPAAIEPVFQGFICCLNSLDETGANIPAIGPTKPKPTILNSTRTTTRVRTTPVAVATAPMARAVTTWSRSGHTHSSKLQKTWTLLWRRYLQPIGKYKGIDDSRGRWIVQGPG